MTVGLPTGWRDWPAPAQKRLLASLQSAAAQRSAEQAAAAFRARAEEDQAATDSRLQAIGSYLYDPVGFITRYIRFPVGRALTGYQVDIAAALPRERRVVVRGPHGPGKTGLAALLILWFSETRNAAGIDWKVPVTAGAWRQLTEFLFPEVHKWAGRLDFAALGHRPYHRGELLEQKLKLKHGSAFAVASDDPALIEGAHAESILYVFDESKVVKDQTFDAAEGAFSAASQSSTGLPEAFALALSTPGSPSGRFYDLCSRAPGFEDWWARHITLEEAIEAGRIDRGWAEQRAKQWASAPAVYANRVLGEFHAGDEQGVIPLAWAEAAVDRWKAWRDSGGELEPLSAVGVDVADEGDGGDETWLALRHGPVVAELRPCPRADTMQTASLTLGILIGAGCGRAIVDSIGLGAGVYHRLREELGADDAPKATVQPFVAGAAPPKTFRDRTGELGYVNLRSAAWYSLREQLDPDYGPTLCLPDDPELLTDLTGPRWRVVSGAKIQVESKDDIRKRIGRSTDRGDAVMQACWMGDVRAGQVTAAQTVLERRLR